MPPMNINRLLLLGASLIAWKLLMVDWIVITPYRYTDTDPPVTTTIETRVYRPRASPIWDRPTSRDIHATAESWLDHRFFPISGTGSPTEEPQIRIDYLTVGLKLLAGFFIGYCAILAISFISSSTKRKRHRY